MTNLLTHILTNLASVPDELNITEVTENDVVIYTIKANNADIPRIIGRSGSTIKAIDDLLFVAGQKTGSSSRYILKVEA